jgi:hypothetical protein
MALLPGDYKRRVFSTNKGAAVNSGYAVSPVYFAGGETGAEVAAAGSVITVTSVNVTSTGGVSMWFQDSAGTKQYILQGALTARDYKQNFYCPWPVYITTDVSVTIYVAPPAKGATWD